MLDLTSFEAFSSLKTPFYYYDAALLKRTISYVSKMSRKYGIEVHYAIKANPEERILRMISSSGLGADCVSGNEIVRAIRCGFKPSSILFAGVGKTDREIRTALRVGIGAFNCESVQELKIISSVAEKMRTVAPVSLRINPGIDAHTHKYITTGLQENKFGIDPVDLDDAVEVIKSSGWLDFKGVQFHIGSQILGIKEIFSLECRRAAELVSLVESKGLHVNSIDLGGGLGADYDEPDENPIPDFGEWFKTIVENLPCMEGRTIQVEPGRALVAQCGSLIARVIYIKPGSVRNFMILDGGMNDLIRPALYGAWHKIENLSAHYLRGNDEKDTVYDVVGPVCESADVFGTDRLLRESFRGDLIAIRSAGAYGAAMSSSYNLRTRARAVYSDEITKSR